MKIERESTSSGPQETAMDFVLPACVCGSLRQASRALTLLYDQTLRPAGLTAMQFQILMTIQTIARATIKDLVVIATIDQTTLTRSLSLMVQRGWLMTELQTDRRSKAFQLTQEGRTVLATALPLWNDVQQRVVEQLRAADWNTTRGVLGSLIRFAGGQARDQDCA